MKHGLHPEDPGNYSALNADQIVRRRYQMDNSKEQPKKQDYTFPFRVGRKQKRAMLDAKGIEIVVFNKGQEDLAQLTCDLLNNEAKRIDDFFKED